MYVEKGQRKELGESLLGLGTYDQDCRSSL